jgi:uncharacterized protein (TIGR03067 family)
MFRFAPAVVLVLFVTVAFGQDNATEKDLKGFQGTWKVVSMMWGGREDVDGNFKDATTVIAGNEATVTIGKDALPKVVFKLDATKKPATIDLGLAGEKSLPNLGIYELKGDMLTVCWGGDGKPRPTRFASTKEGDERLLVLQRLAK